MWGLGSYSKCMYSSPQTPLVLDWVHAFKNGTYRHFAESRHSTDAISSDAQSIMQEHSQQSKNPLFLYVAFTAAHSPLQPIQKHLEKCKHIPHIWRRLYCGMVIGLDEAIKNITDCALKTIGNDTIVYVTSDNGGSTWFGGLNTPYRGG
jgi:arylsulfatase A-like enzyme